MKLWKKLTNRGRLCPTVRLRLRLFQIFERYAPVWQLIATWWHPPQQDWQWNWRSSQSDHNLIFNKKSLSNSDSIAQKFLEVLEITSNFDLQNNPHKLSIRKYKLRWAKRLNLLNWIQATGQATICGPQYGQFIGWNLNIKRFSLKITDRSVWKDSIESF